MKTCFAVQSLSLSAELMNKREKSTAFSQHKKKITMRDETLVDGGGDGGCDEGEWE